MSASASLARSRRRRRVDVVLGRRVILGVGLRAGHDVGAFGALVLDQVEDGAPPELLDLVRRHGVGERRAVPQRLHGRLRARRYRAQEGQGCPPADPLALGGLPRDLDRLARVGEDALEQLPVRRRQVVGRVDRLLARRERRLSVEIGPDVGATALDEVPCQLGALLFVRAPVAKDRNSGLRKESSSPNASSLPECGVAVTRSRWRSCLAARSRTRRLRWCRAPLPGGSVGAGVRLVDDHELGRLVDELVAAALALDEVHRHDGGLEPIEDRLARTQHHASLEPRGGCGHDQLGVDVELVPHLRLPLLREVGRAEDGTSA